MPNFGGNEIRNLNLATTERMTFADSPYSYRYFAIRGEGVLNVSDLKSFTIYVLSCDPSAKLTELSTGTHLHRGDAVQSELRQVSVGVRGGKAAFLIAGVADVCGRSALTITKAANLKKVTKPWGHELWINGEHPGYALKQIAINAPHKTSLQYHHYKRETNVLMSGAARLHYKHNSTSNDVVTAADIATTQLSAGAVIDVTPEIVHRIEAATDLLLYEVSTPHLDDVVRISDDAKRPDGRIAAEHQAAR